MYTSDSSPIDILVRTSGEIRFSDFLLWQCSHTPFVIFDVLWPEYSWFHFCQTILYYQRHASSGVPPESFDERIRTYLEKLQNERRNQLEAMTAL